MVPAIPPDDSINWSLTTFDGSRREQCRRWSLLPLEDIIRAQEEMHAQAQEINPEAYAAWIAEWRRTRVPKRIEDMTMDEVEALYGPGALVPADDWLSRRWQCGRCEKVYDSDMPVGNPSPCDCGSVVLLKLEQPLH